MFLIKRSCCIKVYKTLLDQKDFYHWKKKQLSTSTSKRKLKKNLKWFGYWCFPIFWIFPKIVKKIILKFNYFQLALIQKANWIPNQLIISIFLFIFFLSATIWDWPPWRNLLFNKPSVHLLAKTQVCNQWFYKLTYNR